MRAPTLVRVACMLLAAVVATAAADADEQACRAQGFDRQSLLCGTCRLIAEAGSSSMLQDCLACCKRPFDLARLEVSFDAFQFNAALQEFVSQRHKKMSSYVEIKYNENVPSPRLTLVGDDDTATYRIGGWTANDIEQFLLQYFVI